MLSISTQQRILNLFQQIARGQKEVESRRQQLAELHNFSPYSAFRRLDRYNKDHLTSRDFLLFLSDNYVTTSQIESYDLMKSFDKYGIGRISYTDFRNGVLPSYCQVLREVAGTRPSYRVPPFDPLPYSVERALANLLHSEVKFQREVAQLRGLLRTSYDFSVNAAFTSIASSQRFIYASDIRDLFRRCGRFELLPSEQQAIMRRLDQDGDGRLSFNQFYEAVNPTRPQLKAPETSYAYQRSSPSPVRRLTNYSSSPQRRSYGYSASPSRRPMRSIYESPARRSYQAPISYASPARTARTQQNRSSISGNTQPYEYSPLRGYTAVRDHPNSSSYYKPVEKEELKQYEASPPQRDQINLQNNQGPMRVEQNNEVKHTQEASQPEDNNLQNQQVKNQNYDEEEQVIDDGDSNEIQQKPSDEEEGSAPQEGQMREDEEEQEKQQDQKEADVFEDQEQQQHQPQNNEQQNENQQQPAEQSKQQVEQDPMQGPAYSNTPPAPVQNQAQSAYFNTPPQQLHGQQLENPYRREPMASSSYSRYSPEKQRISGSLARRLRNQMAQDTRVEYLKQELAIKADFNLDDAFDFFDVGKRGKLTSYDLKEGLMDLRVYCPRQDAQMLIQKYDEDRDGMLNRVEFGHIFCPSDPVTAQQLLKRQSFNSDGYYSRKNIFTKRTEGLMQDVLRALINSEKSVEDVRVRLRLEGSTVRDAFEALDKDGKGHISKYDMSVVMDQNYVSATKNQLVSFMDRFDKDKDGKVSYSEFVDEMIPKSPSRIY